MKFGCQVSGFGYQVRSYVMATDTRHPTPDTNSRSESCR